MVTLQDIANRAGVSKGTVSYVLSGKHEKARIGAATCERIRALAREMGYRPNTLARAVATGKSKVLGLLTGSAKTEFAHAIIDGMQAVLEPQGYLLKLLHAPRNATPEDWDRVVDTALEQRLAAVISHGMPKDAVTELEPRFKQSALPFGIVSNSFVPKDTVHVGSNDADGVAQAVAHLASLGHSRIAFVAHSLTSAHAIARLGGYREGMTAACLPVTDDLVVSEPATGVARQRALELVRDISPVTAFICDGDTLALELLTLLAHEGIRTPEDVSFVGFGNFSFSGCCVPSLTTIYEPYEEMGRAIVARMLDVVNKKRTKKPVRELIDTRLIVRESTGQAPNRG